jgi:hypothetical protein
MINKFAYFSEGGGEDAAGDAAMFPLSNFTGIKPAQGTGMIGAYVYMFFNDVGDSHGSGTSHVTFKHEGGRAKDLMNQICEIISSNPKDGFLVLADHTNNDFGGLGKGVIIEVPATGGINI